MSLFHDADSKAIIERIEVLSKRVGELKGERDALRETVSLTEQLTALKKQIADAEIQRGKQVEIHEREQRDVKHMIGLEKKRQEFEIDAAKRETTVKVREENLNADKKRFEEQMTFQTERFQSEVKYLKGLMETILSRLPTVTVDKNVSVKAR